MDHCRSSYPSPSSSSARFEDNQSDNDHHISNNDDPNPTIVEREHMFDKVVTPSDVGKLNRLVIPKQHAEKYFPLSTQDSTTSSNQTTTTDNNNTNNPSKGLLLNFEDRTGKSWRFRYSYWNSSQSYVMTKGWSRFVKEKKLDAGDIVSFHRAGDKFFIDWRRRPRPDDHHHHHHLIPPPFLHFSFHRPPPLAHGGGGGGGGGGGFVGPGFVVRAGSNYSQPYDRDPLLQYPPYHQSQHQGVIWDHLRSSSSRSMLPSVPHPHWITTTTNSRQVLLPPPPPPFSSSSSSLSSSSSSFLMISDDHRMKVHGEEGGGERIVYDSVPVVQPGKAKGVAAGKRLRLFGVNMDCPPNNNNSNSRDSFELYHDHTIPTSSPSITSDHDHHRMVLDNHEDDQDQLPLQLSLPVDKGKLSSSSSSMSLDLDM